MTLLAAATLGDDIVHTPLIGQILKVATTIGAGLLTGLAIGAAAVFIVGTGGLGAVVLGAVVGAVIGVAADAGARALGADSLEGLITKPIHDFIDKVCPGVVKGQISTGSPNVFINSLKAARAAGKPDPGFPARQAARAAAPPPSWWESVVSSFMGMFSSPEEDYGFIPTEEDKVLCSDHPPHPEQYMAQGSSSVFINGQPAVRITDKSTCEGKVSINPAHAPRRNVSIGGETIQVRAISSEMPHWLAAVSRYAGYAIAVCMAIRGKGPLLEKVLCLVGNMAIGMVADAAVRGTASYLNGQMGHPVHVPTGAKVLDGEHDQDFVLAARLPVDWTRCYNSLSTSAGLFGTGWVVLYELELLLNQPDPADPAAQHVFLDTQGRRMPVPALAAGEKFHAAQEGMTFAHTAGGHYMVQFIDGLVIDFGQPRGEAPNLPERLRPQVVEDRNGNASYLRYDESGRLTAIATSCGQQLLLDYGDARHPGRVSAIRRQDGSDVEASAVLVRYGYDTAGNLNEVRNRDGEVVRRFAYDEAQRMIMQRLPQGLEVRYDWQLFPPTSAGEAPHARVTRYATSAGDDVRIDYALAVDGAGSATSLDQFGRSHRWQWDADKRVTHYRNPLGEGFALEWAPDRRELLRITNPAGGITRLEYDADGNLSQETDPLGQTYRTRWHPQMAEPVAYTAPDGMQWRWHYDATGNLVHETGPAGLEQHWTHDEHGAVIAHVDARGGASYYGYEARGLLVQATDCSQRVTRYQYDADGNLAAETDAAGQRTSYAYDGENRPVAMTLPDGLQQAWRWHAADLPAAHERAGAVTEMGWNPRGQLIAQRDAVGAQTHWRYDSAGRLRSMTDGKGATTHFEHDAADRQTAQVGIDGLRTEYTLDALGQPVAVTQAAGTADAIRIELARDALGRLVCKATPETLTRYGYDAAGRVLGITRRVNADAAPGGSPPGQIETPEEALLPLIDEVVFGYDGAGRLSEETTVVHRLQKEARDPGGGHPGHNGIGSLDAGAPWEALPRPRRTTLRHEFDPLGFTTRTTLPGGQQLDYLYYGSGHLHQISLQGVVVSDIERDALHRETARTQGELDRELSLDPMGRTLRAWSARRGSRRPFSRFDTPQKDQARAWARLGAPESGDVVLKGYAYDPAGNLSRRRDALLGEQHFQHDKAGRILQSRSAAPAPPLPASTAGAFPTLSGPSAGLGGLGGPSRQTGEAFRWDEASNALPLAPATATDSFVGSGSTGRVENNRVVVWQDIRYSYDAHGRIATKQAGQRQTTRLAWNSEHQLVASSTTRSQHPAQHCRYHYDALGRRIGKTDAFGTTWFTWSGMRMLQEERGAQCVTTVYEDAESYAPLARIEHEKDQQEIDLAGIFHFHTDINGAPEELTTHKGKVVWKARYRTWGSTVLEEWDAQYERSDDGLGKRSQNLRFQGQYLDAETGLHYNTFRYYDPDIGRFATQDPIGLEGGQNLYQYAPDPLGWIDPWGWCPVHHQATNKHGYWSPRFRGLFKKYGLGKFKNGRERVDVLNDPINKIAVPGHKGPHPEELHQHVYDRLSSAGRTGEANGGGISGGKLAIEKELKIMKLESTASGSWINKILTKTP